MNSLFSTRLPLSHTGPQWGGWGWERVWEGIHQHILPQLTPTDPRNIPQTPMPSSAQQSVGGKWLLLHYFGLFGLDLPFFFFKLFFNPLLIILYSISKHDFSHFCQSPSSYSTESCEQAALWVWADIQVGPITVLPGTQHRALSVQNNNRFH